MFTSTQAIRVLRALLRDENYDVTAVRASYMEKTDSWIILYEDRRHLQAKEVIIHSNGCVEGLPEEKPDYYLWCADHNCYENVTGDLSLYRQVIGSNSEYGCGVD